MWDGKSPVVLFGQGTASDIFFRLGFVAVMVIMRALAEAEAIAEWCLSLGNADCMEQTDAGARALDGSEGISLCKFDEPLSAYIGETAATPSDVEPGKFYEANGIRIDTAAAALQDGIPFVLEVWPLQVNFIRAVHDGGDNKNTYFEDSSIDFKDAGVEGGQKWILINESNDEFAFVKSVEKPVGKSRHCRIVLAKNSAGDATASADTDNDDVAFLIPTDQVQYPLSGIGAMS